MLKIGSAAERAFAYYSILIATLAGACGSDRTGAACAPFEAGEWVALDHEEYSRPAAMVVDVLKALDSVVELADIDLIATCQSTNNFFPAEYRTDLELGVDTERACAAVTEAIEQFRGDHSAVRIALEITEAESCGIDFEHFMSSAIFCDPSLELDEESVMCLGTWRECAYAIDPEAACVECEGDLAYNGLAEECQNLSQIRAQLLSACPRSTVRVPDSDDPEFYHSTLFPMSLALAAIQAELPTIIAKLDAQIDALRDLQAEAATHLDEAGLSACTVPANQTLTSAINDLARLRDIARQVDETMGEVVSLE